MAVVYCQNYKYKYYNGGWSSWSSTLHGGYAGSSYAVVIQFTVPDFEGEATAGSQVDLKIPVVRGSNHSKTGTMYAKLYTSDPTAGTLNSMRPTAIDCEDTWPWNTSSQDIKTSHFIIKKSIKKSTTYWLALSASNTIQVGHNSTDGHNYVGTVSYTEWTSGTVSKPTITQTAGVNTYNISCSITNGTNNSFESATLYYTTNGTTPTTSSTSAEISTSKKSFSLSVPTNASSTIKAFIKYNFTHNNGTTSEAEKTVKYYTNGKTPTVSITDNADNTFTISGKLGAGGINNPLKSATLYYTTNGESPNSSDSDTTQKTLTSFGAGKNFSIDPIKVTADRTVKARVFCTYTYGVGDSAKITTDSGEKSTNVKFYTDGGSPAISVSKDNGNNTFTISGKVGKAGSNNAIKSSKLYYSTDGGNPGNGVSIDLTKTSEGAFTKTINVPSSSASSTVKTFVRCVYNRGDYKDSAVKTFIVYRHSDGTAAEKPTITQTTDNIKNNKFTIKGKVGKAGTNNNIKSATLYYTIGSNSEKTETLTTTSEGAYSFEFTVPDQASYTTIKAKVVCIFNWGTSEAAKTKTSSEAQGTVYRYSGIGSPAISITDNGNNTFTITGTAAKNGWNNTASTSYEWGYTTAYGNSGTGTKSLTIAKPSDDTRTVYAKATATPAWSGDTSKTVTASTSVKQYVEPKPPKDIVLTYTKSRLTIKEPWRFTWTPAEATNSSSSVKGYVVRLYKNSASVLGLSYNSSDNSLRLEGTDTTKNYVIKGDTTCEIKVDPDVFDFKPGDTVQLGLFAYTENGIGTKICSNSGKIQTTSNAYTVQNAGIVNVKVNGAWKEGQVYVKVNGTWKEAETVNVKTSTGWKESQ